METENIHAIDKTTYDQTIDRLLREGDYNFNPRSHETFTGSHDDKPTPFKTGLKHLRGLPTTSYHRQQNRTCGITFKGHTEVALYCIGRISVSPSEIRMGRPTAQWKSVYQ